MGTEIERALDRISEIHAHLARNEVYRGYRTLPVALSGACAFAAAALYGPLGQGRFVLWWMVVGALAFLVASGGVLYRYALLETPAERRRTRRVLIQLAPALVAGAAVAPLLPEGLLPGIWAMLFALGLASVRPSLPRGIGWLVLYYLGAGVVLLWRAEPSAWAMGATFGAGQLAAGLFLLWNRERRD